MIKKYFVNTLIVCAVFSSTFSWGFVVYGPSNYLWEKDGRASLILMNLSVSNSNVVSSGMSVDYLTYPARYTWHLESRQTSTGDLIWELNDNAYVPISSTGNFWIVHSSDSTFVYIAGTYVPGGTDPDKGKHLVRVEKRRLSDGVLVWSAHVTKNISGKNDDSFFPVQVLADSDSIYVPLTNPWTNAGSVLRFDKQSGAVSWSKIISPGSNNISAQDLTLNGFLGDSFGQGFLYVKGGKIFGLSKETGSISGVLGSFSFSLNCYLDSKFYALSPNGSLTAPKVKVTKFDYPSKAQVETESELRAISPQYQYEQALHCVDGQIISNALGKYFGQYDVASPSLFYGIYSLNGDTGKINWGISFPAGNDASYRFTPAQLIGNDLFFIVPMGSPGSANYKYRIIKALISSYVDSGIRIRLNGQNIKLASDSANGEFMFSLGGQKKSFAMVDVSDANASQLRVKLSGQRIKAVRKY